MSEMERNKGWLTKVADSAEEFCKRDMHMGDLPPAYKDWEEFFREEVSGSDSGYMILKGAVYEVYYEVEADTTSYSFSDLVVRDNVIHFHTMHYNGGGSLEDVIEAKL